MTYCDFQYELLFCIQDEMDASRMIVQSLINKYPSVDATVFLGKAALISCGCVEIKTRQKPPIPSLYPYLKIILSLVGTPDWKCWGTFTL